MTEIKKEKKIKPKEEVKEKDVVVVPKEVEIEKVSQKFTNIIEHNEDPFGKITRSEINLIKNTVAVGASDDELKLFIQICRGAKLNPFMRQAHFVPFWDSRSGTEKRAVIIGIDGFRSIAEESGHYAGNDDAIFVGENEIDVNIYEGKGAARKVVRTEKLKVPEKATVTVYKIVDGVRCPFTATARWSEYYPGEKKGGRWIAMPYLMLAKCAEALALRKAFPSRLSGIYSQEEMDQAISSPAIDEKKKAEAGFKMAIAAIGKMKVEELESYKKKMQESEKYSDAQKNQFTKAVDEKLAELKNAK